MKTLKVYYYKNLLLCETLILSKQLSAGQFGSLIQKRYDLIGQEKTKPCSLYRTDRDKKRRDKALQISANVRQKAK